MICIDSFIRTAVHQSLYLRKHNSRTTHSNDHVIRNIQHEHQIRRTLLHTWNSIMRNANENRNVLNQISSMTMHLRMKLRLSGYALVRWLNASSGIWNPRACGFEGVTLSNSGKILPRCALFMYAVFRWYILQNSAEIAFPNWRTLCAKMYYTYSILNFLWGHRKEQAHKHIRDY